MFLHLGYNPLLCDLKSFLVRTLIFHFVIFICFHNFHFAHLVWFHFLCSGDMVAHNKKEFVSFARVYVSFIFLSACLL